MSYCQDCGKPMPHCCAAPSAGWISMERDTPEFGQECVFYGERVFNSYLIREKNVQGDPAYRSGRLLSLHKDGKHYEFDGGYDMHFQFIPRYWMPLPAVPR